MDYKKVTLLEEKAIKERVGKVWEVVFSASNKIIAQAQKYGFHGMELIPDPNIHVMLGQLRILGAVMASIIASDSLEYEETRSILNAKEQLTRMELVALALQAGNRDDYDRAISDLERQAVL